MLILRNKARGKSKANKIRNIILIFFGFIFYSTGLILLTSRKDLIKPFFNKFIPVSTKQIIKDSIPYQIYKSGFKVNLPLNYINGILQESKPIYIDIKQKDYEKLLQKRNEAIKKGVLLKSQEDYVSAIISENNKTVKAKIRLKGDWPDHLQGNKWSYRVKVIKNQTFRNMKKFSLHAPVTRNYIWEWVYLQLLKDEGLPSLRYSFRPLIINGNSLGMYALEEHFDKILLESNSFKEGPIIKLNEDGYWLKKHQNLSSKTNDEYFKAITNGFKLKTTLKNDALRNNFLLANQILNAYREGLINTSVAFDAQLLSRYLAINDLTDAHHSSEWINERFYFDTVQSKLIPIGFDGDGVNEFIIKELSIHKNDPWRRNYFNDIEFTKNYIKELERVSKKLYLDQFFERNSKEFRKNKYLLYKSYPALNMSPENLYKNQKIIKEFLNPPTPLNIFLKNVNEKEIELNIGNNQLFPIEIIALRIGNSNEKKINNKYILKGKKDNKFVDYKELNFKLDKKDLELFNKTKDIKIIYKLYGSKNLKVSNINTFPRLNPIGIKDFLLHKKENLNKFSFFEIDNNKRTIEFISGIIYIDEPLIIPKDYTLIANEGVKIIFKNKGMIISKSPLDFKGNINNPIEILSTSNNESNGISVINANKESFLENIIFKNLSSNKLSNWQLSGAISFYQSPVRISNCSFEDANAEDSLNIIRSQFKIINSNFIASRSDAIDIDFSDGEISNVNIIDTKNDGLDISGSNIYASNIFVNKSSDKAFSIGEGSNFIARNLIINNSKIGFASKDGSNSNIINLKLNNTELDIVGFQKKVEYSPTNIIVKNLENNKDNLNYFLGIGSSLIINQNEFLSNKKDSDIFKLLYR